MSKYLAKLRDLLIYLEIFFYKFQLKKGFFSLKINLERRRK